jgi:hypothetical protein
MSEPESAPAYVLRSSPFIGDTHCGVRVDKAGNYLVMTHGKPRALVALLRLLADEVEQDGGAR